MKNTLSRPLVSRTQKPVSASPGLPFSVSPPHPVTTAPFDPALPEDGALILAEVLRDQYNALNAEILQRVTQAAFDAAVASLNAALNERATYPWVVNAVNAGADNAVATVLPQTSANSNGVAIFDQAVPSYYDTSFTQSMADKVNELIEALRR